VVASVDVSQATEVASSNATVRCYLTNSRFRSRWEILCERFKFEGTKLLLRQTWSVGQKEILVLIRRKHAFVVLKNRLKSLRFIGEVRLLVLSASFGIGPRRSWRN
jgi:hypothetical protein